MSVARLDQTSAVRLEAAVIGPLLFASSSVSSGLAWQHVAALGTICGARAVPHCGWCYAAAGFAVAGISAFGAAIARKPLRLRPVR